VLRLIQGVLRFTPTNNPRSSLVVGRWSLVIRRSSFVVGRSSFLQNKHCVNSWKFYLKSRKLRSMKTAQTTDGQLVEAAPGAPRQAICPQCGGVLTLRSRRTMDNGHKTFFWRHPSNSHRDCRARHHPTG
jgi:hypothetical protein